MPRDRRYGEVPSLMTTAAGILVAVVCAVFGIGAHGLAAGMDLARLDTGQALLAMGVSAAVGAAVARLARRRSPLLLSGTGMLAGQGLIHLVLSAGHAHADTHGAHPVGRAPHGGSMPAALDGTESAAVGATHVDSLLTPTMLGAHLAAIGLTVALVALLIAVLEWGAARMPTLPTRTPIAVGGPPRVHDTAPAPDARYLLSAGGTRAPPPAV